MLLGEQVSWPMTAAELCSVANMVALILMSFANLKTERRTIVICLPRIT